MIQRLGCLVASISFAFVGATAFADAWFDGKISETPALTGGEGGFWNVPATGWDSATKTYNNFNEPLKFTAEDSKSNIVSITTSVKFTAKDELLDSEIAGAKGGLAVFENEDSTATNYYGVVSGKWEKLSGVEPDLTKPVAVSISLFSVGKSATTYINYSIDGQALKYNSNADIATTCAGDGSIKSVEYLGKCELASLSGATAAPYVAQGADQKFYKTIAEAGEQAVTIVNATSYTPTATTIGSCNISDPDGFLTLNQGSLANVGLKVATVNGQVAIRPNFTSNDGDGSAADKAFKIGSAADLEAFRKGVLNQKFGVTATPTLKYFKQTADIDLGSVAWAGVGTFSKTMDAKAFCGYYDGGNKTIKNLYLALNATPKATYAGLFGQINGSTVGAGVKNLTIEWAGWKKQDGSILVPTQADNNGNIGGAALVGLTEGNVDIENVTAKMANGVTSISGTHSIAGLGVKIGNGAVIKNCTNEINIIGMEAKVGGLLNLLQGAKKDRDGIVIEGCVNKGTVTAKGTYEDNGTKPAADNGAGGLAAYVSTEVAVTVKNCESYGKITADGSTGAKIGSIVGFIPNNSGNTAAGSLTAEGTNKARTDILAVNSFGTKATISGFNFATVESDDATFVSAPVANGSYMVMTKIAAPAADISLTKGQTIEFDDALYTDFDATDNIVAADTATTKITSATSGTVTTFTCAEKAKATVSITMTGATATVSVAHGASVYEGTKITVTGEAATEGYEAPITVTIKGVEQKSYTTTASDTSIAIVITATSKIVPIDPDPQETDVPKITVDKDALAKRGVDTSDIAKIKTYLKTKQPNGQKGWVNYALGIGDANEVANTPVLVDESTEANKIQINLGINYEIKETSGCSAKIVKGGDKDGVQVSEDGEIILTDTTATEVFTVKFVVTDKDGKAETVVEKYVGIENKAIASEMEILSVPFTDMNSAEQISVDKLIKTMNISNGDRLMVYNGTKGVNEGWTFSEGAWTHDSGVGAAAETFVKPGDGIWFQRANPSESTGPIFKFGAFSATKAKTVAPADGWKLVANPNLTGEVNLNNGFVDNPAVADEIQVETATVPTIYTYDSENWGFDEMQVTGTSKTGRKITKKVRNTTDAKIGPGAGFWFGNSGSASKNLDWSK